MSIRLVYLATIQCPDHQPLSHQRNMYENSLQPNILGNLLFHYRINRDKSPSMWRVKRNIDGGTLSIFKSTFGDKMFISQPIFKIFAGPVAKNSYLNSDITSVVDSRK